MGGTGDGEIRKGRGMKAHPDMDLARRAEAGENAAWREIYDATKERLFALIAYHTGDREEALDVLQETYTSAVRGIKRYRGEGSLESWLCGIALRRARDWKRRFLARIKSTDPIEAHPVLEAAGGDPEEARLLRRALSTLPPRQRAAFLLHEWMGYSFGEAAKTMGVKESTARVHAHRAKEALRAALGISPAPPRSTPHLESQEQRP